MKAIFVLVGLALVVLPVGAQNPGRRVDVPVDVSTAGITSQDLVARLACVQRIADQATSGCLLASSTPTPGMLFPPPHDGGVNNTASGSRAFLGGGQNNSAPGPVSVIGGGSGNTASGNSAVVGGGYMNTAQGAGATVGGGGYNATAANYAAIGGGRHNYAAEEATVAGGEGNTASGTESTVGGGRGNTASGILSSVGGGLNNTASLNGAMVGGGWNHTASGVAATVGGGFGNTASEYGATVAGGIDNTASGFGDTVGGGRYTTASGAYSTVGGGLFNTASGARSTVPGGMSNTALGRYSFVAGRLATANHPGAFVWGDSQNTLNKTSSRADEFNVHASGGARFFSNSAATTGVLLAPGGGSWTAVSSRDMKENVEPVDARAVLERVIDIPVSTWNYKEQSDSIRHMGPMAQDFYAAFGLGLGEMTIDTIDPDGVALAAIQGLRALVKENEERLAEKDTEIAELRERLERLEELTQAALAR